MDIDERLVRIVCCVSDGYSLVACCCKLIMQCSIKLCANSLLKLWKERMLVGSTLFLLSVNAAVYVIAATAEEASLLLLFLLYIMFMSCCCCCSACCRPMLLLHCRRPARSSLSAPHCVRCAPWPLSRAAARAVPATLAALAARAMLPFL